MNVKYIILLILSLSTTIISCKKDSHLENISSGNVIKGPSRYISQYLDFPADTCKAKISNPNRIKLSQEVEQKMARVLPNRPAFAMQVFPPYSLSGVAYIIAPPVDIAGNILNNLPAIILHVSSESALPALCLWHFELVSLQWPGVYRIANMADPNFSLVTDESTGRLYVRDIRNSNMPADLWDLSAASIDTNSRAWYGVARNIYNNNIMRVVNRSGINVIENNIPYNDEIHNANNLAGGYCDVSRDVLIYFWNMRP